MLSMVEIECALTILGVKAKYQQIRDFVKLTDANKDGRIDGNEL